VDPPVAPGRRLAALLEGYGEELWFRPEALSAAVAERFWPSGAFLAGLQVLRRRLPVLGVEAKAHVWQCRAYSPLAQATPGRTAAALDHGPGPPRPRRRRHWHENGIHPGSNRRLGNPGTSHPPATSRWPPLSRLRAGVQREIYNQRELAGRS